MEQKSGASERRSEVSRVPTPYADITQIRFWGLRITALSAPVGAPPSYSVVAASLPRPLGGCRGSPPAMRQTRERGRATTMPHVRDTTGLVLGGLRLSDLLDRLDLDDLGLGGGDEPRHHQDRERREGCEFHLDLPL